jgi:hypothetical protein
MTIPVAVSSPFSATSKLKSEGVPASTQAEVEVEGLDVRSPNYRGSVADSHTRHIAQEAVAAANADVSPV